MNENDQRNRKKGVTVWFKWWKDESIISVNGILSLSYEVYVCCCSSFLLSSLIAVEIGNITHRYVHTCIWRLSILTLIDLSKKKHSQR